MPSPSRPRTAVASAALAVALACLAAWTATADARTIERGDHGRAVKTLQRSLHLRADGRFGRGTVRAVKRFQRRHHLRADGVVGPGTWRLIRRRGGRPASRGRRAGVRSRGSSVRLLQRRLRVAQDGVLGPGTARALRRFQRRRGLTADGVAGPATWRALGVRGRHPVLKGAHAGGRGRRGLPRAVVRAIRAANRIAGAPYRYGGGHGSFSDTGYDCSGSLSYVLHGAGRLDSPLDSGQLMSYGRSGRGRWITIYANPGHAFMVIRGRRFDTSGRSRNGSRWGPDNRSSAGYAVRHPPGL
jgi:cell wall-associated NlpC family hydrolase